MGLVSALAVIKLDGELEIGRKAEIRDALRVADGATGILVDFSGVTYADSTTLAELLRFRSDAARRGIPVAVVIGSRQFARLIQYAGLGEAFAIFDNRGAALTYLGGVERP
jgi:anti-anti-sigma factor